MPLTTEIRTRWMEGETASPNHQATSTEGETTSPNHQATSTEGEMTSPNH